MTGDQLVAFLYQVAAGVAALGIGVAAASVVAWRVK